MKIGRFSFLFAFLALSSCGDTPSPDGNAPRNADGGANGANGGASGGASGADGGAREGVGGGTEDSVNFEGVFHLPNQTDAINLAFLDDGVFVLAAHGCDFCAINGGMWSQDGDTLILTPFDGYQTIPWIYQGEFTTPLTQATVIRGEPTGITIEGVLAADGSTFEQVWTNDRVCAECNGEFEPTEVVVCDVPFSQAESDACPSG